ncbi:hypothetical protein C1H46_021621 [Malus baccata]|uniref:Mitochondrial fission 1 protein n=1 Tax=Malus baccata TaxID=106549 RepID=A0A540M1X6_MALBA|nr:hypothetical protein C1H46_021621 [Malus baccata]
MADNVGKFFDSVSNFFSGGDQIPWCDRDLIAGIEKEVADAQNGSPDHVFKECLMRLSWALIAPDWRQALNLKKMNEARIKRDGAIGIGIAATAVGLLAGGIAAAVARKK